MPDVGSFFEKLTKGAKGGRRLTRDRVVSSKPSTSKPSTSDGGIRGRLRDLVDKAKDRTGGSATAPTTAPTTQRNTTAVTIEYSPAIDGDPDPGDVVWTWVPFEEDPTQGKDRPVVIIGRRNGNLVGIPLTTKADDRELQVAVGRGDWDPERRPSYARIWRLLEVDEQRMRREGAILDRIRFDAIIDAVDDHYEVIRADKQDYDY